jgi:hypothetical protein
VRTFELRFSEASMQLLLRDPSAEEYVEGTLVVPGLGDWPRVGIRAKGYFGSLRFCFLGSKCNKLSWKVKVDYKDKDQTFYGLKKLQFHASLYDLSLMRERLAYSLFREMGVGAPRSTHAYMQIRIGDGEPQNVGVHLLTEVLDKRFVRGTMDDGDGNLYKEAWPGVKGEKDTRATLETNGKKGQVTQLLAFGDALKGAKDDYDITHVMLEYTNVRQWARYMAVDRAIEHSDGPLNFRVDEALSAEISRLEKSDFPVVWNHNFFLYESAKTSRFEVVGWDVDFTFYADSGAYGPGRPLWDRPVCAGNDAASEALRENNSCGDCTAVEFGSGREMPASCIKSIRAFARGLRAEYVEEVHGLLAGPLLPCRIEAKLKRWAAAVAPFMARDVEQGLFPAAPDFSTNARYTCCPSNDAGFSNCDDTRCTSPDGKGNYDCTASMAWNEVSFHSNCACLCVCMYVCVCVCVLPQPRS